MLYHAYIRGNFKIGRTVCIDGVKLTKDNWPYFEGDTPSITQKEGPY